MIAQITGSLAAIDGDHLVIRTAAGLGYDVMVPQSVLEILPPVGGEIELATFLVVREDSLALYGFASERDRAIFQRLLGTSGVGPRLALTLLSSLGARRLMKSLRARDIAALTTVPGIGRKTAERLSLEMADRLKDMELDEGPGGPEPTESHLAAEALVQLGYSRTQADSAVRQALADGGPLDVQTLIRKSLQHLGA